MSDQIDNGRQWPDNSAARALEDQALLDAVAALMLELLMPHSVACPDCSPTKAARIEAQILQWHADWLRHNALNALINLRTEN